MVKTKLNTLKEKISQFSQRDIDYIYLELNSTSSGLSEKTYGENLEKFGANEVTSGKKNIVLEKLIDASLNPFNLVLIS